MTESMPPTTPEEIRQLNRSLMEKILDRAANDPAWKQRLLDDPEVAKMEAGFPEAERLREMYAGALTEAEVAGQQSPDLGQGCTGCIIMSGRYVTGY